MIAAPGHTGDSTAYWNGTTGTLLSGDAVLSTGGKAWVTPETADDDAAAATVERLRQLDVRHLLPGHGRPVHGTNVLRDAVDWRDGPHGIAAFASGLTRCLLGRTPG